MKRVQFLMLVVLTAGGCAGLNQFPDVSRNYAADLSAEDTDYSTALNNISIARDPGCSATTQPAGNVYGCGPDAQKLIRNEEIDRRLRVIDLKFSEFQAALAKENVQADFGIGVVGIGVGAAGALVSETASQILSAVSGGLAGTRAAYTKATLFDKAFSALLAQMIASRKSVLVRIYEGRRHEIDEYPLSAAVQDLEAYNFAGSLPGAVVGTSADATVKNNDADAKLETIRFERTAVFLERARIEMVENIISKIQTLDDAAAIALVTNPPVADEKVDALIEQQNPSGSRFTNGDAARSVLIIRVREDRRTDGNLQAWANAMGLK